MLYEFSDYVAERTSLEKGKTLLVGIRPPVETELCTSIIEGPGKNNAYRTKNSQSSFRLTTRGTHFKAAHDEAFRIFQLLFGQCRINISGHQIYSIVGDRPVITAQDDKGRCEFTTNLLVRAKKES